MLSKQLINNFYKLVYYCFNTLTVRIYRLISTNINVFLTKKVMRQETCFRVVSYCLYNIVIADLYYYVLVLLLIYTTLYIFTILMILMLVCN